MTRLNGSPARLSANLKPSKRERARLRACARGRIVYCIDGPSEAHRTHNRQNGRGAAANCSLARSGWRNPSFKAPAERYSSRTMRVPIGVIGIIYEARPEVTIDA